MTLRAVVEGELPPDDRVPMAKRLLRALPPCITDDIETGLRQAAVGEDWWSDRRFLAGRLAQGLAALLEEEMPPPDALTEVLGEAISDAMAYRHGLEDYPQIDRYHLAALAIGAFEDKRKPAPGHLRAVDS